MRGNWIIKVYKNPYKQKLIEKYFVKKDTKSQGKFYLNYYVEKPKRETKKLRRVGIPYSCYKVEYERAVNYRAVFFNRTKGPYRCRYCNKWLRKEYMVVDHIVPVAKTQKTLTGKLLLKLEGCQNVNDIKNLAPSCSTCNSKKSDKMGLWVMRGWLGRYRWYWKALKITKILIILLVIYAIYAIISKYMYFDFSSVFS